jgi:shikimate kinase
VKIVLIGFMGSGKSKVGRLLAKKLGWPLFDTDEMLVKEAGASIADLIKTHGEPLFRSMETKLVQSVAQMDSCVVSTGGGVPLNPKNMELLENESETIWLKVSPEAVLKRAGNLKTRPLIDPKDPLNSIRRRLNERIHAYARARHVIDTDTLEPEAVVKKILSLLPK